MQRDDSNPDEDRSGYALVLAGAVAISFKSIFVKWAYELGIEPAVLLAMRVWIALPLLIVTLFLLEGRRALALSLGDFGWMAATGLCLGAAMLLSFHAIDLIGAALATLVTFTYPAWTVALIAITARRSVPRRTLASLAFTFVGLLLVVDPRVVFTDSTSLAGCALALGAALAFACQNTLTEHLVARIAPIRVLTVAMAFVAIGVLPVVWSAPLPESTEAWGVAALLGIVSGYAPFIAFSYGIRMIGAGPAAILTTVSPPLTILWAALFLGERLGPAQILGTAVLVSGVRLVQTKRPVPAGTEEELAEMEATAATR